jgi:hypothetical protein
MVRQMNIRPGLLHSTYPSIRRRYTPILWIESHPNRWSAKYAANCSFFSRFPSSVLHPSRSPPSTSLPAPPCCSSKRCRPATSPVGIRRCHCRGRQDVVAPYSMWILPDATVFPQVEASQCAPRLHTTTPSAADAGDFTSLLNSGEYHRPRTPSSKCRSVWWSSVWRSCTHQIPFWWRIILNLAHAHWVYCIVKTYSIKYRETSNLASTTVQLRRDWSVQLT